MREIFVWNENVEATERECGYECRCADCEARMRKTPLRQIRERVNCKLAGYPAEVRHLGHLYSGIAQDRVQVKGARRRVRDVAEIGDRVTATIEADRMKRIEDEHG